MFQIFIDQKIITLTNDYLYYKESKAQLKLCYFSEKILKKVIKTIIKSEDHFELLVFHDDLHSLWKTFLSFFTIVEAAGGIVKNNKEEFLVIYRNGFWDLPKGKLELNENNKDGAIREVQEETGIKQLNIVHELPTSYHIYKLDGKRILKITHWFMMTSNDNSVLKPQIEEGITEVRWMNQERFLHEMNHSYLSLKELVKSI